MELVAWFIAWLDWQSDAHLEWTAIAAVVCCDGYVSAGEAAWWSAHPVRTRALVDGCLKSGWVRCPGWPSPDYDVRDLRNYCNVDYERTYFEVKWTLNRLRDRRWGIIQ